ncbi:MAG TPA: DUF1778 domain-containing protein [Bryobacteraceae bacterium]|jgi:uncharacterized protein (DUF1778 family)
MKKKSIGSSVDCWLPEDGISKEVTTTAIKRVAARAMENLPDRQRFSLTAKQSKAFQTALSTPPRRCRRLVRLLKEASVFERAFLKGRT